MEKVLLMRRADGIECRRFRKTAREESYRGALATSNQEVPSAGVDREKINGVACLLRPAQKSPCLRVEIEI
jgi:hypothetical protein